MAAAAAAGGAGVRRGSTADAHKLAQLFARLRVGTAVFKISSAGKPVKVRGYLVLPVAVALSLPLAVTR